MKPVSSFGEQIGEIPTDKKKPTNKLGKKRNRPEDIQPNEDLSDNQTDHALSAEGHRKLVSSIFDVGMIESSPAAILEHMTKKSKAKYDGLNLERIKSKLQKYRKGRERNKYEFMNIYDISMARFCKVIPIDENLNGNNTPYHPNINSYTLSNSAHAPPETFKTISSLSSGEAAAFLSHSIMLEDIHLKNNIAPLDFTSKDSDPALPKVEKEMADFHKHKMGGTSLVLPPLTKEEKSSPLGMSITAFEQCFRAIVRQLHSSRSKTESKDTESEIYKNHEKSSMKNLSRLNPNTSNGVHGVNSVNQANTLHSQLQSNKRKMHSPTFNVNDNLLSVIQHQHLQQPQPQPSPPPPPPPPPLPTQQQQHQQQHQQQQQQQQHQQHPQQQPQQQPQQ